MVSILIILRMSLRYLCYCMLMTYLLSTHYPYEFMKFKQILMLRCQCKDTIGKVTQALIVHERKCLSVTKCNF
jgi:hypothetical protein